MSNKLKLFLKTITPVVIGTFVLSLSIYHADVHSSSVTTSDIADGAVTTPKLANNAATLNKIANNVVNHFKILNGEVGHSKIATNAIDSTQVVDGALQPRDFSVSARTFHETVEIGTIAQQAGLPTNIPLWLPPVASNVHVGKITKVQLMTSTTASPPNDGTTFAIRRHGGSGTVDACDEVNLNATPITANTPFTLSNCDSSSGSTFDPTGSTAYSYHIYYIQGSTGAALSDLIIAITYEFY